jgi:hypothetical protein
MLGHIRSGKAPVGGANDHLLQGKRCLSNMFQQQVASRALATINALIVLQHVLHLVQRGVLSLVVLPAITANNLHSEPPWHDLAFVAILEAVVLGFRRWTVLKLPPLCLPAVAADLDGGAWRARRVESEGAGDGHVAQRVERVGGRFHVGTLLADAGLRAPEVALARRSTGPIGVRSGRPPR